MLAAVSWLYALKVNKQAYQQSVYTIIQHPNVDGSQPTQTLYPCCILIVNYTFNKTRRADSPPTNMQANVFLIV